MGRPLRIEFPSAVYHVTSRGDRERKGVRALYAILTLYCIDAARRPWRGSRVSFSLACRCLWCSGGTAGRRSSWKRATTADARGRCGRVGSLSVGWSLCQVSKCCRSWGLYLLRDARVFGFRDWVLRIRCYVLGKKGRRPGSWPPVWPRNFCGHGAFGGGVHFAVNSASPMAVICSARRNLRSPG